MLTLLFLFWVILNGKITLEIILFGIGLTAGIFMMMRVLFNYSVERELNFLKKAPLFIGYIFVLIREVIKANIHIMSVLLKSNQSIEPTLVTLHSGLKTGFGNYVLANSITLTPGTITESVEGDKLTVHCLQRECLDIATFVNWIKRMEA